MRKCAAHLAVVYTGTVASAATMPMFYADELEIADHTSFMFHEPIIGSVPETMSAAKAQREHEEQLLENLMRDVYAGFFTEEEIEERLLKGEQIYMLPEEVMGRWMKRNEFIKQQMEENVDNDESNE